MISRSQQCRCDPNGDLIRSEANLYHVKELLGHESLSTVKHYAKLTITDLKRTHAKCHPREKDKS